MVEIILSAIIGFSQGYIAFPTMRFMLRLAQNAISVKTSNDVGLKSSFIVVVAMALGSGLAAVIILSPMVLFSVLVLSQMPKSALVDATLLVFLFLGVGIYRLRQKHNKSF